MAWLDLRLAVRTLARKPFASAMTVGILAIGIGATTAVFTVLNAVAFRDLPVKNPSELVELSLTMGPSTNVGFSVPMIRALAGAQQSFSSLIGFSSQLSNAEIAGELTQIARWPVTANFFSDLGVIPQAGRLFVPDDMRLASFTGAPVVVLGNGFWRRAYGGDPGALGKQIRLDGQAFTIVGIAPKGFSAFSGLTEPDAITPLGADDSSGSEAPSSLWIHLVGRLRPGVTAEGARGALAPLWASIKSELVPATFAPQRRANFLSLALNLRSARSGIAWMKGGFRFTEPLWFALALAVLVLIVSCLNVAGLVLARSAGQARDIGIRLALGASTWDIQRQAVTEAFVLATLGAVLGLVAAEAAAPAIAGFMIKDWPGTLTLRLTPDLRTLGLIAVTVGAVSVLFGILPFWRADSRNPVDLFQGGARIVRPAGRLGAIVVAAQVALALVASVDAGLLVRTLHHFAIADPGFDRTQISVAQLMPRPGVQLQAANATTNDYQMRLVDAVRSATGAQAVALTAGMPLAGADWLRSMAVASAPAETVNVAYDAVSPEFVDLFGLVLREGRSFTHDDDSSRPKVALVSESLARRVSPRRSALGEYINFGPTPAGQHIQIVGVLRDFRLYDVKNGSALTLLLPTLQNPESSNVQVLVKGTFSEPALRRAVSSVGLEYVLKSQTLDDVVSASTRQERFAAAAGSVFGGLSVGLAALGLYGLLTYLVTRRTRELAIRAALGGDRWSLVRLVFRQGASIVAAGVAIGAIATAINVRWLQSLLFNIGTGDGLRLAVVPLALAAVALVACAIPAVRAGHVNPMVLMRDE
jgi:putative ABC transport system permease protein